MATKKQSKSSSSLHGGMVIEDKRKKTTLKNGKRVPIRYCTSTDESGNPVKLRIMED